MLLPSLASAQMWQRLTDDDISIDTTRMGKIQVQLDALSFFRDNEYLSDMQEGYSLPGTWVRPTIQYTPLPSVHIEAGAHALFFDGANKYPCYAYHDIGTWKGNQYQSGAHILPWFRAQVELEKVMVVMGDIYGGTAHRYTTPLYNNEQLLSADPEMGAQILYRRSRVNAEAYVNWQSYQFEEDTHQEAFTVGATVTYSPVRSGNGQIRFSALAQHRGGEQDIKDLHLGVQTITNASLGFLYAPKIQYDGILTSWQTEANILACYQQSGHLWPFKSGIAFNAEGCVSLGKHLGISLGEFYAPGDFITIYGNPFFSTVSTKSENAYKWRNTLYGSLDYSYTIAKDYTFGANIELYQVNSNSLNEISFAFGLYLRVSPGFLK